MVSLIPLVLHRENDSPEKQEDPNPMEPEDEVSEDAIDFHGSPPSPGFDCEMCCYRATIARLLTIANIAYTSLTVKPNRKSPYFEAFSGFAFWIKKFYSPKMRNREFLFIPKNPYDLLAEPRPRRGEALTFPKGK